MLDKLKSKCILKKIFEIIKRKRKLNIIKYNKRISFKLNINKEDFEIYIILKEYNKKYNTNIDDIDSKELDLNGRHIRDEGLIDLFKIEFQEINKLDLNWNLISDINILGKINFKELQILDLSYNLISDINILEKVNFKILKELSLSWNVISDINILGKVNFKELKVLYLSYNKISDINVLEGVNFKELQILDLSYNKISDINICEKVNFENKGIRFKL